jgi:hypothetical protein
MRREVENPLGPKVGHRARDQVAFFKACLDPLDAPRDVSESPWVVSVPDQESYRMPFLEQAANEVRSDETGSTGDERPLDFRRGRRGRHRPRKKDSPAGAFQEVVR